MKHRTKAQRYHPEDFITIVFTVDNASHQNIVNDVQTQAEDAEDVIDVTAIAIVLKRKSV